jgi:hypothetical protein
MNYALRLQAGGTLNPKRHIYIIRPEDDRLFELLLAGEYVNVLTSRQMGKSSMMVHSIVRLAERGVRSVAIDLAGEIGTPDNVETFYIGLLGRIARDLQLTVDVAAWWREHSEETFNQRLLRFFREVVNESVKGPLVIFLDEIDSTLKLPFTDDLFTAIRSMYNDRPLVPAYERITFCLLGVASANELVKDRRSTPYNVGETLELGDFDAAREDVSALAAALSDDPRTGTAVIERVLYWTGGHPYLTARLCVDLHAAGTSAVADVDRYVETAFVALDRVRSDAHFAQTLRFVETRLTSGRAALSLYRRILNGAREKDVPAVAHNELKLSGLVKRDAEGYLVVRNPIYRRLFNLKWVESLNVMRERGMYRFVVIGSLILSALLLMLYLLQTIHLESITAIAFSPDGRRFTTGSQDKTRVWDVQTEQLLMIVNSGSVSAIAFSPDGRRIATGSWNKTCVWDAERGLLQITLNTSPVSAIAFSDDGRSVATGCRDNTRVWDTESGRLLRTMDTGSVHAIAFSPDGRRVAVSSTASTRVWDVETGQLLRTLDASPASAIAFSPDGRRIATGSWDKISIWDAERGLPLTTLHTSSTYAIAFSPNGRRVVTSSYDYTARLWDVETGLMLQILEGHIRRVTCVAFSPDGRSVATGSADSTARMWDIETGDLRRYYGKSLEYQLSEIGTRWSTPAVLAFLALLLVLDFVVIREVVSGALSATRKAAWSMIVLFLPLLGIALWLLFRPGRAKTVKRGKGSPASA